ncbi:MAG: MarR family transcriptional regulator [Roseburia sp.]|nr:MarR family transcriptional regulator [Ruminococcus sp.]MCM1154775.1 MarR family transcriptional regulator [Roseburia sp.]MCM1241525.1 MarR family transcriptional regulator [Roseburia sp.]
MKELYAATAELFRRTDGMLRRCIGKKLRTLEEEVYRSQHRLLMRLGMNPNCSQNELAASLDISPAAVAVSLGKLERSGYITRETNTDDHRSNQVAITEKGDRVIRSSILLFEEVESAMFRDFSEEEIRQFQAFLSRAYCNLENMHIEKEDK